MQTVRELLIPAQIDPVDVCGVNDAIIRQLESVFDGIKLVLRSNRIVITANGADAQQNVDHVHAILRQLFNAAAHYPLDEQVARSIIDSCLADVADARSTQTVSAAPHTAQSSPSELSQRSKLTHNQSRKPAQEAQSHTSDASSLMNEHASIKQPGDVWVGAGAAQVNQRVARSGIEEQSVINHDLATTAHLHHGLSPIAFDDLPMQSDHGIIAMSSRSPVRAKTQGQRAYVNAIDRNTITFGIGPAGTGKTYLAVAKAVQAFRAKAVRRIVLTRPAVEAGENLGFLPGSMHEKVDPYLRPLYDALGDMLGSDYASRLFDKGDIEVAPLAYMRGRTLNDAFVILDEAQNTTREQMKMFLTRLGFNTKMVITGDSTQVDRVVGHSGLSDVQRIIGGIDDIAFITLTSSDVVRHRLVGRIVQAYGEYQENVAQYSRSAR